MSDTPTRGPDGPDELEAALRRTLHSAANRVPPGHRLAEQILREADRPGQVVRGRFGGGWRSLTLPLVAAASVVAVATGIVLATQVHSDDAHPATRSSSTVVLPPAPLTTSRRPSSVTASPTTPPAASTGGPALSPVGGAVPANSAPLDLTFVGSVGWALISGDNLDGTSGRSAGIARTADGGSTWVGVPTPAGTHVPIDNSCAAPCIEHLRFANDETGYAYGPSALYLTRDGGATWTAQPGGALALESLDSNVIRVTSSSAGCTTGCPLVVQTAPIGSGDWTTVALPDPVTASAVQLVREPGVSYLLARRDPAAGGTSAPSVLFTSGDDGGTWVDRGEACRQGQDGAEVDSVAIAAATDGSVTVACHAPRSATGSVVAATSTDGGLSFVAATGQVTPAAVGSLGAASATRLFLSEGDSFYASLDGGTTWQLHSTPGPLTYLGFESATVGRGIGADGRTIWTTTDGGTTWSASTVHG